MNAPAPANLADVVRGFTAADWREAAQGLAFILALSIAATALLVMLEP